MCGHILDDEVHFLFHCQSYVSIRENCGVLNLEAFRRQDIFSILSSDDDIVIKSVAKFIAEALKLRQLQLSSN